MVTSLGITFLLAIVFFIIIIIIYYVDCVEGMCVWFPL